MNLVGTVVRARANANGDFVQPDVTSPPKKGELCPAGDRCDLGSHLSTESDFTGFGLRNFTRPPRWSYIVKGCADEGKATEWFTMTWDADVPANTSLTVHARSGPTMQPDATWGRWTADSKAAPVDLSAAGVLVPNFPAQVNADYLQVEFTFRNYDGNATPTLKSLTVAYRCKGP